MTLSSKPEVTVIDGGDISADVSPELAATGAQYLSTGVTLLLPFFDDPSSLAVPLILQINEYERSMFFKPASSCQKASFDALCENLRNIVLGAVMDGRSGLTKITTIPWKPAKDSVKTDKDIISAILDLPAGARSMISKKMMLSMLSKVLVGKAGIDLENLPQELQDALKPAAEDPGSKQTH